MPQANWWQSKLREAEAETAKPLRRPALLAVMVLVWGGLGLTIATESHLPAAVAWVIGLALMWRHRVAWWGSFLARRDHEPRRYWAGFLVQVVVALVLVLMSALAIAV